MKLTTKIAFFLLLTVSVTSAQQIYFTSSYTEDGDPIGAKNIWLHYQNKNKTE